MTTFWIKTVHIIEIFLFHSLGDPMVVVGEQGEGMFSKYSQLQNILGFICVRIQIMCNAWHGIAR